MRILVLGGTGFIGPHVVATLADRGHMVTVFHRGDTEAPLPLSVEHIHGDMGNLADFSGAFARLAPDVIVHMLLGAEQEARAFMDLAHGLTRRVIAISSMDVYRAYGRLLGTEPGPPDPVPLTEDAPLREVLYPYRGKVDHLHDYDKILVERVILGDPALPGTVLRLPMVYGPRDDQHRLFPYLKRMDDQRPAIVLEERRARLRATRGYVENVAAAIVSTVTDERAAGRIYNVGEPDALTEEDWVRNIGRVAGWRGRVVVVPTGSVPDHVARPVVSEQEWVVDTTRLRQELGYTEPVPRDEALRRTVAWEQAHPPGDIDPRAFDYGTEDAALARVRRGGTG